MQTLAEYLEAQAAKDTREHFDSVEATYAQEMAAKHLASCGPRCPMASSAYWMARRSVAQK